MLYFYTVSVLFVDGQEDLYSGEEESFIGFMSAWTGYMGMFDRDGRSYECDVRIQKYDPCTRAYKNHDNFAYAK